MGNIGFNLMDGGPTLLDLRIADDIQILAHSRVEAGDLFFFSSLLFDCRSTRGETKTKGAGSLRPAGVGDDVDQRRHERPGIGDGRGRQLYEGAAKSSVGRNGQHLAPTALQGMGHCSAGLVCL